MDQQERKLIERYLQNDLTGSELSNFVDHLERDDRFRKQVTFLNALIESIQIAHEKELSDSIVGHIAYRKPLVPSALKLIFVFLAVTGAGIILWSYIGTDAGFKRKNYSLLELFRSQKSEKATPSDKKTDSVKTVIPVISSNSAKEISIDSVKSESEVTDSVNADLSTSSEIVVKQDQFLISHELRPVRIEENQEMPKVQESVTKSTVNKLNPAGGLPDIEKTEIDNYMVEFWVSPVNYRGYKLVKDKLILFGIDEPDAVELFSKGDKLWLKYGHDFYSLEPSDNFEAFIETSEIPIVKR